MTLATAQDLPPRVETGALSPREQSAHRWNDRPHLLHPGDLVSGTYEVHKLIGQGGMGQVYEAYDRLFGRRVALKVARPHAAATLLAEAEALSSLRHASIVALHAVGQCWGTPYLVLEHVDGTSLDTFLRSRNATRVAIAVDEALDMAAAIADALVVVHGASLAHRDIKPANILLARDPSRTRRRIVLTDFGICQSEHCVIQAGSLVCGSPSYIAPETIRNSSECGARYLADLYALGVVVFEMLAGRAPFARASLRTLFWSHLRENAPDIRSLRPDAPRELAALLGEMLAKDPKRRPRSAEIVAVRLRRIRCSTESDRVADGTGDERDSVSAS